MTEEYVTAKVHEALKATGGDKKDAQKLLITWAVRDQALLLGLAKPHLKALVASRIDHATRSHHKPERAEASTKGETLSLADIKGDKRRASKVPPPKSSQRQASVMHQLVAAFKKKKS